MFKNMACEQRTNNDAFCEHCYFTLVQKLLKSRFIKMTTSAQAMGTGVMKSGWLQRQSKYNLNKMIIIIIIKHL